ILCVFIPPVFSFTIDSLQTAVRFGVTVSAGVGTSLLVESMRRANQRALLAAWLAADALRRARLGMAQRKSAEAARDASQRQDGAGVGRTPARGKLRRFLEKSLFFQDPEAARSRQH